MESRPHASLSPWSAVHNQQGIARPHRDSGEGRQYDMISAGCEHRTTDRRSAGVSAKARD